MKAKVWIMQYLVEQGAGNHSDFSIWGFPTWSKSEVGIKIALAAWLLWHLKAAAANLRPSTFWRGYGKVTVLFMSLCVWLGPKFRSRPVTALNEPVIRLLSDNPDSISLQVQVKQVLKRSYVDGLLHIFTGNWKWNDILTTIINVRALNFNGFH